MAYEIRHAVQGTIPREWGALAMGLDELSLADNSLTGALLS